MFKLLFLIYLISILFQLSLEKKNIASQVIDTCGTEAGSNHKQDVQCQCKAALQSDMLIHFENCPINYKQQCDKFCSQHYQKEAIGSSLLTSLQKG